jgi:Putative peptidoglycan binding domain
MKFFLLTLFCIPSFVWAISLNDFFSSGTGGEAQVKNLIQQVMSGSSPSEGQIRSQVQGVFSQVLSQQGVPDIFRQLNLHTGDPEQIQWALSGLIEQFNQTDTPCFNFRRTLFPTTVARVQNKDVARLQRFLEDGGYDVDDALSGVFDSVTAGALMQFQQEMKSNGLLEGAVNARRGLDSQTRKLIRAVTCEL